MILTSWIINVKEQIYGNNLRKFANMIKNIDLKKITTLEKLELHEKIYVSIKH